MKKVLSLLFLFLSAGLWAQNYDHHDFSLSYGVLSPDRFYTFKSSSIEDQLPDDRYVRDNFTSPGNIFLTYRFTPLNEYISYGSTVGYGASSAEVYYMAMLQGTVNRTFYTAAFEFQVRYVNDGPFQMYSGAGVGITYGLEDFTANPDAVGMNSKNSSMILPGYQINLVGVRFGKRLGGYLEFGFGYKGVVNLGLAYSFYKFGRRKY